MNTKPKEPSYVPYTLKDYKLTVSSKDYKMPTSLGSNVGSTEWVDKKAKQVKMAEFGSQINSFNKQNVVSDPGKYKSMEEMSNAKELKYKKRFE